MTALNFPANPSNGDVYENYQYDGTDGVWKRLPSSSLGINGLADVTITTPADGESLVYDNATGEWINADATVEVYGVDTAATDYFMIPVGGDAERPVTPANGHIRFNTDSGEPEYYSESEGAWFLFRQEATLGFAVEYLVIAGGGGGGGDRGGGGGAGGYRCNVSGESSGGGASAEPALNLLSGTYAITVGAGGNGFITSSSTSSTGGNSSVFSTITSDGGGRGGDDTTKPGGNGGSGGGGHNNPVSGGTGSPNQGFDGEVGDAGIYGVGGGGGGAGEPGGTDGGSQGGDGVSSSITGSSVTRAGGGGGGGIDVGAGGDGGGGSGSGNSNGSPGVANTGGGGGGGSQTSSTRDGGNGGSGVVILKIPSTISASFTVGLTEANGGSGQTIGDYKVYTVTAGTGSVTFA